MTNVHRWTISAIYFQNGDHARLIKNRFSTLWREKRATLHFVDLDDLQVFYI